jgi:hypothetical protein
VDVENLIGIPQEQALQVLRRTCQQDEWVAYLVNETITTTGKDATRALLRLLYLFGIGTTVEGRLN